MAQVVEILFNIFVNQILPILTVVFAGWLVAHFFHSSARVISQVAINVFLPCLIFNTLLNTDLDLQTSGKMVLFCLLSVFISGLVAFITAQILRLDRTAASSLLLVLMFTNVGNFGLPLILYAFGEEALAYGTVYFVVMNLLLYTLGVFMLAGSRARTGDAVKQVLTMPIFYAILLAVLLTAFDVQVPAVVSRPVELMAQGAIPSMLIVLGIQLHNTSVQRNRLTWLAVALRLAVIPLCIYPLTFLLHMGTTTTQAGMLQAATPTGVSTTVLALDYNTHPEFVNNVVFLSTLVSAFTISPLIMILGG